MLLLDPRLQFNDEETNTAIDGMGEIDVEQTSNEVITMPGISSLLDGTLLDVMPIQCTSCAYQVSTCIHSRLVCRYGVVVPGSAVILCCFYYHLVLFSVYAIDS